MELYGMGRNFFQTNAVMLPACRKPNTPVPQTVSLCALTVAVRLAVSRASAKIDIQKGEATGCEVLVLQVQGGVALPRGALMHLHTKGWQAARRGCKILVLNAKEKRYIKIWTCKFDVTGNGFAALACD